MKILQKIIANKFLIAVAAFMIWMLFFDRNDIPRQIERMQDLNSLQNRKTELGNQIEESRQELSLLKTSPQTLEKYAREKYLMKRDNEDLFIIDTDSSLVK